MIDHLGVVGPDIEALLSAYKRLGFTPTEPTPLMGLKDGEPIYLGQDSAHLIFAENYVELSGVTTDDPNHHLAPWLARRAGLHILALGSDDAVASHAALVAEGLEVPAVQDAGRNVAYGKHHGDAKFKWFKAPDVLGEEGFVCLVEQITPELVFQPPVAGHPNGALGVVDVIAVAEDPAQALERHSRYPGAVNLGPHQLGFGEQTLTFLNAADLAARFPGTDTISAPALAGFAVTVQDIAATRTLLRDNGVAFHENMDGDLSISPADGCGSLVEFRAG